MHDKVDSVANIHRSITEGLSRTLQTSSCLYNNYFDTLDKFMTSISRVRHLIQKLYTLHLQTQCSAKESLIYSCL